MHPKGNKRATPCEVRRGETGESPKTLCVSALQHVASIRLAAKTIR
jgi:hypothetical protein